ncbi:glycosyltransferase [Bradyrhizobium sp. RD5-C2]|uniref:glycosyltransferase n=1 Tax=Bradyrhizobium sp. RD5-C2 TaxID=244562 RepID=UPI0035B51986
MFDAIGDPRVRCFHEPAPMTIGATRKARCRAAQGGIIIRFDDDDDYAPYNVDRMLVLVQERGADFAKLFGFRSGHMAEMFPTSC